MYTAFREGLRKGKRETTARRWFVMDKMKMETVDGIARNVEKLEELFPACATETRGADGALKKAIKFDVLRQLLSGEIADDSETYDFTWVGKKAALAEAYKPIRKTLRPCPEESRDWDSAQNLYIEGDNLEVLKLLQESYLGKIKAIYIDPPYNTGNDFIYKDNFRAKDDEYEKQAKLRDKEGNSVFKENNATNPRFHSDWCSMIYSRLLLARALLADDGVIFISIDDNEVFNLQNICNEVFGASNYSATFLWTKTNTPPALSYKCRKTVEYVLAYEKNWSTQKYFGSPLDGGDVPLLNSGNPTKRLLFPPNTIRFSYMDSGIIEAGRKDKDVVLHDISVPNGANLNAVELEGEFKWEQSTLDAEILRGACFIVKTDKFSIRFQRKLNDKSFKTPMNYLDVQLNKESGVGTNESATKELKELGMTGLFNYAKPISLIKKLLKAVCYDEPDCIVLDFFSGSAATAQAVMELNKEDGGARRFIMVQYPEVCDAKFEAFKQGYQNICEIGKERIRRAGDKIKKNDSLTTQNLDVGFRVFKVDSSNMNDVYYGVDDLTQDLIASTESSVKPDRSDLDLFFGCVLEWGLPLSLPYKAELIEGFAVHNYNDGDLFACFEEGISEKAIVEIARRNPLRVVFRDSCFNDVASKINLSEIFKRKSEAKRS